MSLYQITLGGICAGVVTKDKVITIAAPILRWSKGKEHIRIESMGKEEER